MRLPVTLVASALGLENVSKFVVKCAVRAMVYLATEAIPAGVDMIINFKLKDSLRGVRSATLSVTHRRMSAHSRPRCRSS